MHAWSSSLLQSFSNQAGTWFVGVVIAILSIFSGRITESIKFRLNRANLRTKYYEEIATQISHFIFIVDRIIKVFHTSWVDDSGRQAISGEYDSVTNSIRRKEYVYRSWVKKYWGVNQAASFSKVLEKIGKIDAELLRLNELETVDQTKDLERLKESHRELLAAAEELLEP